MGDVAAPVTFAALFELARMSADGPMVDGIHPGSTYGVVAFVFGRGVHALLALLPMPLGATLEAAARHLDPDRQHPPEPTRPGRWVRRATTLLAILGVVTLTAALARPARTAAIAGADGKPVAGSVAELARVQIGGHDLAVLLRGTNSVNPVLLFLAGGPGGTELGAMRRHGMVLEQDFVVATLDQRGTGNDEGAGGFSENLSSGSTPCWNRCTTCRPSWTSSPSSTHNCRTSTSAPTCRSSTCRLPGAGTTRAPGQDRPR